MPGRAVAQPGSVSARVRRAGDAHERHGSDRIAWAIARNGRGVGFEGYHFLLEHRAKVGEGNSPAQMRADQGADGKTGAGRGRGALEAVNGRADRQGVAGWHAVYGCDEAGNTGGRVRSPGEG